MAKKYYSTLTGKLYDTEKDFNEGEKAYLAEQEKIKKEKEEKVKKEKALSKEKSKRAAEIEQAYKDIINAQNKYSELRKQFIKDYGYFHMTFSSTSPNEWLDFDDFFKFW